MENERTIRTQKTKIAESEIAATAASEQIKVLEQKLQEASAREQCLLQQHKEKQKQLFSNDMSSYIKRVKLISVCCCILFAFSTAIVALATGLKEWFFISIKDSWWAYVVSVVLLIGSIIGAIYTGSNNEWLQQRIYKKEEALSIKYGIDKCDVDDVRSMYWHH